MAIEYFDIKPNPRQIPTPNHAVRLPPKNTRSRKKSAPAQAAMSGASGIIKKPVAK